MPSARRYLPGSLILETTWQTHTGWMIVRDTLVMGRWRDIETRSGTHRRIDGLGRRAHPAAHRALRERHGRTGADCEPSFDFHGASANWEYSASGYGEAVARATATQTLTRRCGYDQPAHRAGGPPGAGAYQAERGRQRLRCAEFFEESLAPDL